MAEFNPSEQQAAVAAVAQGQLSQLRVVLEQINSRFDALEAPSVQVGEQAVVDLSSVNEVKLPADDAKTVHVRDTVIELVGSFNSLLKALKATKEDA